MEEPRATPKRSEGRIWAAVAVAALVGAVATFFWFRPRPLPAQTAKAPPPAAVPAAPQAAAEPAPARPMDEARVRSLLEPVSTNASYRRWLGEGELLRRWAVVTDNLSEGLVPRKALQFLAPSRPFAVVGGGRRVVMSTESSSRFDAFAEAVESVDAATVAKVYRAVHPALETAYRALGYPGGSIDRVTSQALNRIMAAPVKYDEIVLVEGKGATYAFADPQLEKLGDVDKQLLRMGPRNTRILQLKAREILKALDLPPATAAATPAP